LAEPYALDLKLESMLEELLRNPNWRDTTTRNGQPEANPEADAARSQRDAEKSQRSEPGEGERVWLTVMDHTEPDDCVQKNGVNGTHMMSGVVEDFAVCHWPVVVKTKVGTPMADLEKHLRNLLSAVEHDRAAGPEGATVASLAERLTPPGINGTDNARSGKPDAEIPF
jgi:hypothetical protein